MREQLRFLGLDVHAETIAVAVAEPDGEVRSLSVEKDDQRTLTGHYISTSDLPTTRPLQRIVACSSLVSANL